VGLFNQKSRDEDPKSNQSDRATQPVAPGNVAQSTRPNRKPPTQGDNDVANIGKSISIKGDLTGNEDIVIEGTVEGKIDLPNNQLTVGANGTVRAEITAKGIVVIGRVSGNVHGTERVEVQATGVVEGDVAAPKLGVAEGAVVNGSIKMSKKAGAANAPTAPTAPTTPTTPTGGGAPEVRKAG
jgi:cytoskeletal protein CcmA (bactofilin family)